MKRPLAAWFCLLACFSVLAAPAPPVFFKPGWDRPVDPDKDCKIVQTQDMLTIELPGKTHDIVAAGKLMNAPRLLRDVKGDFRVDVRVSGDWSLSADSTVPGQPTYAGGGLLLLEGDDERYIHRLEFGATKQENWGVYAYHRHFREQARGGSYTLRFPGVEGWPLPVGAKRMHLRLECRANILRAYYSADGKKWVEYSQGTEIRMSLTARPKLGLAAFSTSKEPCKIYFDQFNLTSPPAER